MVEGEVFPKAGDLVLARVDRLGHHKRIERTDGRLADLFARDEVLLAYGNRYAPDQFEAEIPEDLSPCHMVAAGGIASLALSWNEKVRRPTEITPIGLIADRSGQPINLSSYSVAPVAMPSLPPIIAIAGTSMNSGKTTTAASLVHGLSRAGFRVGAAKLTGTGAGGDLWKMIDAGAHMALDFTDAGHASTYLCSLEEIETIVHKLFGQLAAGQCEVIVAEIADGIFQRETAALLKAEFFRSMVQSVMFATSDAGGARDGGNWLIRLGYNLLGIGGMLTLSPLARREAEDGAGFKTFGIEELCDPTIARSIVGSLSGNIAPARQRLAQ
ncbi:MAG: molybdopterin guanine dinucleotide synthesis B family protein [Pseudomonadota bacterium]